MTLEHGCPPRQESRQNHTRWTALPDTLLSVLSPREHQVVHLLLSFRWTDDALIYPSVKTMAKRLNCSPRTIQRTVRQLEARGFVVVVAQHRSDKSQQSNLYKPGPMLLPLLPPLPAATATRPVDDRQTPMTRGAGKRYSGKQTPQARRNERLYSRIPTDASAYAVDRDGRNLSRMRR